MSEHALPRSERKIEFRLSLTPRTRRNFARPTHIKRVERIRIGSNYHGEPVYTQGGSPRALCGVFTDLIDSKEMVESAGCRKCVREYYKQASALQQESMR
jgi:hypothetical protein